MRIFIMLCCCFWFLYTTLSKANRLEMLKFLIATALCAIVSPTTTAMRLPVYFSQRNSTNLLNVRSAKLPDTTANDDSILGGVLQSADDVPYCTFNALPMEPLYKEAFTGIWYVDSANFYWSQDKYGCEYQKWTIGRNDVSPNGRKLAQIAFQASHSTGTDIVHQDGELRQTLTSSSGSFVGYRGTSNVTIWLIWTDYDNTAVLYQCSPSDAVYDNIIYLTRSKNGLPPAKRDFIGDLLTDSFGTSIQTMFVRDNTKCDVEI